MDKLQFICLKTSLSARRISRNTGIPRSRWQRYPRPYTILFNYGVRGKKLGYYYNKYPYAIDLPTINKSFEYNKFQTLVELNHEGIPCPQFTKRLFELNHGFIFKPYYSRAGHGIYRITPDNFSTVNWNTGYAQREIINRPYEIRVTAFKWMPVESWGVWKKRCDETEKLTWNHEQGGTFINVNEPLKWRVFREAIDNTQHILEFFGLSFGAVDFILTESKEVKFLELNTRPGFTPGYSDKVYYEAFTELSRKSRNEVLQYAQS